MNSPITINRKNKQTTIAGKSPARIPAIMAEIERTGAKTLAAKPILSPWFSLLRLSGYLKSITTTRISIYMTDQGKNDYIHFVEERE